VEEASFKSKNDILDVKDGKQRLKILKKENNPK
jgi:hypothetical protein